MKLIIAGGRNQHLSRLDREYIGYIVYTKKITEIVSGMAMGIDTDAVAIAKELDLPLQEFHALWASEGKSAGYKRNWRMAEYADAAMLFPGGKGTNHMFDIAKKQGLIVYDCR